VLDALGFFMNGPPPKIPRRLEVGEQLNAASIICSEDPRTLFSDMTKLGQGWSPLTRFYYFSTKIY
jgi:hypothetical protein